MKSFHTEKLWYPEALYGRHPSALRMSILPERCQDRSLAKHLLACALASLKANGSHGVYVEVNPSDKTMLEFYTKLGFFDLRHTSETLIVLGRIM